MRNGAIFIKNTLTMLPTGLKYLSLGSLVSHDVTQQFCENAERAWDQ